MPDYSSTLMKERIAYLFNQFYRNLSTKSELEELFSLIQKAEHDDDLNDLIKGVYEEIKQSNPSLTYINEEGKLVLQEPDWLQAPVPEEGHQVKLKPNKIPQLAAACLLVLGFGWLGWWQLAPNRISLAETEVTRKFTNRAEHKYLLLSDSTQVWLNASSSIRFPEEFDLKKREVYLSGEAYFDVKHADKVPFIIHTGEVSTLVLGTAFNIKAYEGQSHITVSVRRGKVQVLRGDVAVSTLTKGQELKIKPEKVIQKAVPEADSSMVGSWQQGYLSYEDEDLGDIIADMERIYNTEIRISNAKLKGLMVTTSFNQDIGAKKALEILCSLTGSKLEYTNQHYLIK